MHRIVGEQRDQRVDPLGSVLHGAVEAVYRYALLAAQVHWPGRSGRWLSRKSRRAARRVGTRPAGPIRRRWGGFRGRARARVARQPNGATLALTLLVLVVNLGARFRILLPPHAPRPLGQRRSQSLRVAAIEGVCRGSAKKRRSVGTRRAPRPAGAATSTRTANGLLLPRVRRARVRRLGEVRGEGHAPTAPKTLRRAQDPSSAVIAGVTRERRRCCRSQRRLPGHAKTNAKRGARLLNPPTEGFSGRQATSGYADPGVMLSQTWTFRALGARAHTGSDSRSTSPFLRPDGSRTSSRLLRFTRRLTHSQI